MARDTPAVCDGVLTFRDAAQQPAIAVGSAAWWAWLDDPRTTCFRFVSATERFTARREHKPSGQYWYAYRQQPGTLRKAYLRCSADLTLERLQAVALPRVPHGPSDS